jgi:endonuclease/exonuclease/phosphatase family metal-dependent hydrolase
MRLSSPIVCGVLVLSGLAFARSSSADAKSTTVTLNQSRPQVVYATLRAGAHQNKNLPTTLTVHPADTKDDNRRAFVKFDTQNTIPAGSTVTSAKMTVTLKSGTGSASRTIGAYQVTTSWAETEMTWNRRRATTSWTTAGGDLGSLFGKQAVPKTAGTKITFDVTALVKQAVAGKLGTSRYTRHALIDLDTANDSTREFYTPDEANAALRPVLTVVYGTEKKPAPTPAPTPAPPGGPTTLRVLHWNTHHGGVGTDGDLDPDRFIAKAASFKPDIVSLNEVERFTGWGNNDGPAVLAALMKTHTGKTWYYKFTTATGAAKGNGNLILSRFPFDASEIRLLSHARAAVDVVVNVNGRSINFMSTHLDDNSKSERLDEIGELTSWAKGVAEPRIIAGDFNASPGSTEHTTMQKTYIDAWVESQADGTAVAYPGNSGQTRKGRIDYIYYSKGATMLTLESTQVFDVRDAHGVMPSDHRPILSIFTVK